jgi:hypothetical protein
VKTRTAICPRHSKRTDRSTSAPASTSRGSSRYANAGRNSATSSSSLPRRRRRFPVGAGVEARLESSSREEEGEDGRDGSLARRRPARRRLAFAARLVLAMSAREREWHRLEEAIEHHVSLKIGSAATMDTRPPSPSDRGRGGDTRVRAGGSTLRLDCVTVCLLLLAVLRASHVRDSEMLSKDECRGMLVMSMPWLSKTAPSSSSSSASKRTMPNSIHCITTT